MHPTDLKYCGIVSSRLNLFKIKSNLPYSANFRCYVCGDSEKNPNLRRGWLREYQGTTWYSCFNCGYKEPLGKFLKDHMPELADEYLTETFLERKNRIKPPKRGLETLKTKVPEFRKGDSHLRKLKCVSQLKVGHKAKTYVESRKIPTSKHFMLYYCPKFAAWTNNIIPGKFKSIEYDEPRLIIPFLDAKGKMFGYAGRSFNPNSKLRYITIMIDEDMPKLFGLNTVDFTKPYFVTEGQIDSMYLTNALAMAGSDGTTRGLQNDYDATFVFDNEPRSKEIVAKMEKVIHRGNKIVIWPHHILDNDIGDMIQKRPASEIEKTMKACTYSGAEAQLELSMWRKC